MGSSTGPPRWTETVLAWILGPGPVARSILGDLREEYDRRARAGRGWPAWWYRREALAVAGRTLLRRGSGRGDWERRAGRAAHTGGGDGMIRALLHEARLAARSLMRAPAFTTVTVLTLALGIGANASMFSVVQGVLLEPLPYPAADRLVVFRSQAPGVSAPDEFGVAPEFALQYREADALQEVGLHTGLMGTLRLDDRTERVTLAQVSGSLFPTLGVTPRMGRLPSDTELDAAFADRPVLLSHAAWIRWFGGDPGVVGRSVDVAGALRTVIGVMGPDLRFPTDDTEAWIPFRVDPTTLQPGAFTWQLVGRMKEGVTLDDVRSQVTPLAERLKEDYASTPRYVAFLEQGRYRPVVRSLREHMVGDLRRPLWILMGSVGVVLLIACANVANLFFVRGEAKERDLAVRAALGSGRANLIRGEMMEALVLAMAGGALGALLAALWVPVLVATAPPTIPRLDQVHLSGAVLVFTALASVSSALLFGLVPAIRHSSAGALAQLRHAGRGSAGRRPRTWGRDALVVAQTSLALVLLVGSGLLLRSFQHLRGVDPGFDVDGVLTFEYSLPADRYATQMDVAAFHTRLLERLRGLPGVTGAGAVSDLPLAQPAAGSAFLVEDRPVGAGELETMMSFGYASPGYFETLGIGVRAGRAFTNADHEEPSGAVVVNERAARELWPGQNPIGKRLRAAGDTTGGWNTVVGVVEDVRQTDLRQEPEAMIYHAFVARPNAPATIVRSPGVVVRSSEPLALVPVVRGILREEDPALPLYRVRTLADIQAESLVRLSFTMFALGGGAVLALLMGAVGLYGVVSYLVTQRTREIGVRLALGAEPVQVRRMVVGQGLRLAGMGLVVGLVAATGITGLLQGLLYGTEPFDVRTFGAVALIMLGVGVLASYLPARRASSVDPVRSMRVE